MLPRVLVAGIVGAIAAFIAGFLIFGMGLSGYFQSQMSDAAKAVMTMEPNMALLIAGQVVYGILLAIVLDWAGSRSLSAGAMGGAVLGFFMSLFMNLMQLAFSKNMHVGSPWGMVAADVIGSAVLGAVAGAVVGFVLGKMNKGDATPAAA